MFNLFGKKRFAPFFMTMGLGAFNDNLFKSALAYYLPTIIQKKKPIFIFKQSAGLFILPLFYLVVLAVKYVTNTKKQS